MSKAQQCRGRMADRFENHLLYTKTTEILSPGNKAPSDGGYPRCVHGNMAMLDGSTLCSLCRPPEVATDVA